MPSCSVCGQETDLHVNGEPTCPECDKPVIGKESRSFEELNEALTLAAQEYFDALDNHSKAVGFLGLLDPGNPAATEAVSSASARLDAASLEYEQALREYRSFKRSSPCSQACS